MPDTVLPEPLLGLAARLCAVLGEEASRYAGNQAPPIRLDAATFTCVIDRTNGLPGYEGVWRDLRGQKCGSLIINSDGSYYAEFDLLIPHPRKPDWFIESVTVWGRGDVVRSEPRLLAAA